MNYDLEFHDELNDRRYRIITKRMTVGDGHSLSSMQAEIIKRKDDNGNDIDDYLMFALMRYPNIVYGTHLLEVQDGDGEWQSVGHDPSTRRLNLSEDEYLNLDELFVIEWAELVLDKNPHRNESYENLKKYLEASYPSDNEPTLTTEQANGKASD